MRWPNSLVLAASLCMPTLAFGAGPEPAKDEGSGPSTVHATLPPRTAPFDPELLARVRAALSGDATDATEEGDAKTDDGKADGH